MFQYCITHSAAKGCAAELFTVKKMAAIKKAKADAPKLTAAETKANEESIGLAQQLESDFESDAKKLKKPIDPRVLAIANGEEHEAEVIDEKHHALVAKHEEEIAEFKRGF